MYIGYGKAAVLVTGIRRFITLRHIYLFYRILDFLSVFISRKVI